MLSFMDKPKKRDETPMTFRFSPEAKRLLREIAQKQGISMTAVLELLIRDEAERRGVKRD